MVPCPAEALAKEETAFVCKAVNPKSCAGQAASVNPAVGVLRSNQEAPVMGAEPRRDVGLGGGSGRGRRLRKEISFFDEKSPTLSVVALANGAMEPDSESRIREIRSSGLMRGEVAVQNRQLQSVQPASFHFACSTLMALIS